MSLNFTELHYLNLLLSYIWKYFILNNIIKEIYCVSKINWNPGYFYSVENTLSRDNIFGEYCHKLYDISVRLLVKENAMQCYHHNLFKHFCRSKKVLYKCIPINMCQKFSLSSKTPSKEFFFRGLCKRKIIWYRILILSIRLFRNLLIKKIFIKVIGN